MLYVAALAIDENSWIPCNRCDRRALADMQAEHQLVAVKRSWVPEILWDHVLENS